MAEMVAKFCGEAMTRREVQIAREAFEVGAKWMFSAGDPWGVGDNPGSARESARRAAARERFPFPKVKRQRVITENGCNYRVGPDGLECQSACISPAPEWKLVGELPWYPAGLACIADLLRNPTEEVEEGA